MKYIAFHADVNIAPPTQPPDIRNHCLIARPVFDRDRPELDTEEKIFQNWLQHDLPKYVQNPVEGVNYIVFEDPDYPENDVFRNAWEINWAAKKVKHNLEKCKAILKDRFRQFREVRFKELTAEEEQARGKNDNAKLADIEAKRQQLRDVTAIDLSGITDRQQLKQIWPTVLGPKPDTIK